MSTWIIMWVCVYLYWASVSPYFSFIMILITVSPNPPPKRMSSPLLLPPMLLVISMMSLMSMTMSLTSSQKRTFVKHMRWAHNQKTDENHLKEYLIILFWKANTSVWLMLPLLILKQKLTKAFMLVHELPQWIWRNDPQSTLYTTLHKPSLLRRACQYQLLMPATPGQRGLLDYWWERRHKEWGEPKQNI